MKARYDESNELLTISFEDKKTGLMRDLITIKCVLDKPLGQKDVPQRIALYENKGLIYHAGINTLYVSDKLGTRIVSDDLPLRENQSTVVEFDEKKHECLQAVYVYDEATNSRRYTQLVRELFAPAGEIKMVEGCYNDGMTCFISRKESNINICFTANGLVTGGTRTTTDGKQTLLTPKEAFREYLSAATQFSLRDDIRMLPAMGVIRSDEPTQITQDKLLRVSAARKSNKQLEITTQKSEKSSRLKRVFGWLTALVAVAGLSIYSQKRTLDASKRKISRSTKEASAIPDVYHKSKTDRSL